MKKSIFTFVILLNATFLFSQNFIMLGLDGEKDNSQSFAKDIASLSYFIDEQNDTLIFKFEFFDTTGGDFGLALGIDTNLNVNDGNPWKGFNSSMQYDVIIFLSRNHYFEQDITPRSNLMSLEANVQEKDDHKVYLGLRLSSLDNDGKMNLIAGTGGFDIFSTGSTYDDIPELGYFSIPSNSSILPANNINPVEVFPIPFNDHLNITFELQKKSMVDISLFDLNGRQLIEKQINFMKGEHVLNLSNELPKLKGAYILEVVVNDRLFHYKVIRD